MKLTTLLRAYRKSIDREVAWEQLLFSRRVDEIFKLRIEKHYKYARRRRMGIESGLVARLEIADRLRIGRKLSDEEIELYYSDELMELLDG